MRRLMLAGIVACFLPPVLMVASLLCAAWTMGTPVSEKFAATGFILFGVTAATMFAASCMWDRLPPAPKKKSLDDLIADAEREAGIR